MTREGLEMRKLVRESDVIDKTDNSELAKAFNHLWDKYIEQEPTLDKIKSYVEHIRNTGLGKKKSLEFIEKFIDGLKTESEEP